jgi:ParB family chromosome partitioning protein
MHGRIDMGHARALLPLDKSEQLLLANRIAAKGLSVRETERMVKRELEPHMTKAPKSPNGDLVRLQEDLSDRLGADVRIQANAKGVGTLSVRFASLDQLEGILARLQ